MPNANEAAYQLSIQKGCCKDTTEIMLVNVFGEIFLVLIIRIL